MTRWLKAAQQFGTRDNWDKTDKTPDAAPEKGVLSVKSVLSGVRTPEQAKAQGMKTCAKCGKTGHDIAFGQPDGTWLCHPCSGFKKLESEPPHTCAPLAGTIGEWEAKQ